MTKYREIIQLRILGFSQHNIMANCGVSQKTVVKVQKRARELNLSWMLDKSMTDRIFISSLTLHSLIYLVSSLTTSSKSVILIPATHPP